MSEEKKVTLNSLSEEEYKKAKEAGHEKFKDLFTGKLVINRSKDYLEGFKKDFKKALDLGYSFADLAKVMYDERRGITFTAKQIRDFCRENGITKSEKISSSKKADLKVDDENNLIPTGNRKRPQAEI